MANTKMPTKGIEVFFSYSHEDEALRDELEKHLSILMHRGLISAWHDRKICAGVEWNGEIDEHLNSAQIILLLISSDFLASKYCYDLEMKRAMERHNSEEACVIPIILRHTYWEGSPFSKLQALPTNAEPVKDGNWRSIDVAFKDVAEGLEKVIMDFNFKKIDSDHGPVPSTDSPKTIIVDQMHRGDFTTIMDAVAAAVPGSRISIHPGVYDEGLIIDKPLEIVGDGKIGEIVIRTSGKNAILFRSIRGKISNLLIRQNEGGKWFGVDISQGCLELYGCDIMSDSLDCVAVHGNAYPIIFSNIIHDGKCSGIFVYENGQGVIEDNEICGNALSGVEIETGGNPTIRRNKIHDGKYSGIFVCENGRGAIEDNEIYGNASAGVEIKTGGNPTIRHNHIHDGVYVYENGQGVIEDNEIYGSALAGVEIKTGGNPTLKRNKIHDGKGDGIYIHENGQGVIEDNEIYGNALAGVEIKEGGDPTLRRNKIHDGKCSGIFVFENGRGAIEDNEIYGNALAGVEIKTGGNPTLKRNKIHDGKSVGISVYENGQGVIENNDISGNASAGVHIRDGGNPTIKNNRINKNSYQAIWIEKSGAGTIVDNDLRENRHGPWNISEDSKSLVKRARNQER